MPKLSLRSFLVWTLLPVSALAQQAKPTASAKTTTSAKIAAKTPSTTRRSTATSKKPLTLDTPKAKFSYALGMNLGAGLHHGEVDVDPDILAQGLKDALGGGKTLLTEEEAKTALTQAQNDLREREQAKEKTLADANRKQGEEFLTANKTKEGVVTLPSGLQYKILTQGTGPKPVLSDTVVCNYRGTLIDGTEFDSSYKRGRPVTFPVTGVIKGWVEALQLMPVGSKWQLFIPSDLAYGEHAMSADLGPNSTLIFEVELLSIKEKTPPAAKTDTPDTETPDGKTPDSQTPDQPQGKN